LISTCILSASINFDLTEYSVFEAGRRFFFLLLRNDETDSFSGYSP